MRIIQVGTTLLHNPEGFVFQDATVPAPPPGASGRSQLFVHVRTDEGLEGLGQCAGLSATRTLIEDALSDVLIGEDPFQIEKLWSDLFWRVRGYGRKGLAFQAISGIDIALWDLKAKALGLPLYRLLGPYTDSVPVYASGGWTNLSINELVEEQAKYVEQGFTAIKLKVGKDFGQSEREDLERLAAVRAAVGDDVEIFVDANNGYSAKQAIRMAARFEAYNIGWFEEPVLADDIPGLAAVAAAISIPVATGENEYTKFGFRDLLMANAADIVQPDVGRVGGVTEWMKIAHIAHAFNRPVAPHAFQLVHLHLGCATPNLKLVEYLGIYGESDHVWYKDVPEPKDGRMAPFRDRPGLGLELNPKAVSAMSV